MIIIGTLFSKVKRELKEAYVIENLRTPFGRRNGYFRNTHPVNLLGNLARELLLRLDIEASSVDDLYVVSRNTQRAMEILPGAVSYREYNPWEYLSTRSYISSQTL